MSPVNDHIQFLPFEEKLTGHFSRLNTQWLQRYFTLEPADIAMLENPGQYFINKGGLIYFAACNNEIAGTFALIREPGQVYELSKMAVEEKFQGHGIGNQMMEFAIAKCRELKAAKIILYSNTMLGPALHLYKKFGFTEVALTGSIFKRSNIKMELIINAS